MLRIALDTNVVISGLFFKGNERELLVAGLTGRYALVMSEDIFEETLAIVERKFRGSDLHDDALLTLSDLRTASEFHNDVYPSDLMELALGLIRDPEDAVHVAFILTAEPKMFVTGDRDFLAHPKIGRTLIVKPGKALKVLGIKH